MELDIKNLGDQNIGQLIKSLELVSARLIDAVVRTNQLAGTATPEMHALFSQWVECLGGELTRAVEERGAIEPEALAREIGISPSTVLTLAFFLHRQGKINITEIKAEKSNGANREICGCLRAQHLQVD